MPRWSKKYSKELLYNLYVEQRLSIRECSAIMKCQTKTVMVYLEKNNIPTRSISDANKGRAVWNAGKKGCQVAWNKGLKGVMKPNKTSFKKGQFTKEKHPMWKGGITNINKAVRGKSSEHNMKWREDIFKRDNYSCQLCGENGKYLHAHHIKPFAKLIKRYNLKTKEDAVKCFELWDINNGITLCRDCHKKAHSRKYRAQLTMKVGD